MNDLHNIGIILQIIGICLSLNFFKDLFYVPIYIIRRELVIAKFEKSPESKNLTYDEKLKKINKKFDYKEQKKLKDFEKNHPIYISFIGFSVFSLIIIGLILQLI